MKVYVAGGSSERGMVRGWIERLRAEGIEITHDWTDDPGYGRGCGREVGRHFGDLWLQVSVICGPGGLCSSCTSPRRIAQTDRDAIDAADVVWILMPAQKSEGAAWEFGYAVGKSKHTIVSGERTELPFRALASDRCEGRCPTHEEAHEEIRELAGRDHACLTCSRRLILGETCTHVGRWP